ncbi:MAG: glucose PTS transporter subunit IIA [Enterococcus sp.]
MNYKQTAEEILKNIGGSENIDSYTHCATRLRFYLKDSNKTKKENLENIPGVLQFIQYGGQDQVVIGSEVVDVYDEIEKLVPSLNVERKNEKTENKKWYDLLFSTISAIFTPYIGVLAAAGILKGLLMPLSMSNLLPSDSTLYMILMILSSGVFTLLPLFIAVTAAEHFKTNRFIAIAVAAAMIYPLTDGTLPDVSQFLGLSIAFKTYGGAVVPTILAIWGQSYVERAVKRVLPKVTHTVFVPFFTLLITGIAVFLLIGPFGNGLANMIGQGYFMLYEFNSVLAGATLAGLFQLLVMVGLHWGILPIALINIQTTGVDTILPIGSNGVFGQFGAVVGTWLFLNKGKDKEIAASSSLSGLFGITEPAIYGITLKYKMPFIIGSVAAAIGGAISGFFHTEAYSFTPVANIFTLPMYIGEPNNFQIQLVANAVSFFVALIGTAFWTKHYVKKSNLASSKSRSALTVSNELGAVVQPMEGELLSLDKVNDPVFSSKSMGEGFAVKPTDGMIYAPVTGKIEFIAQTKHAIGFTSEDQKQILIHIGLNTVELDGKGFDWFVEEGQTVQLGQPIGTVNLDELAGYDTTTMVILTNTFNYEKVTVDFGLENHLIATIGE